MDGEAKGVGGGDGGRESMRGWWLWLRRGRWRRVGRGDPGKGKVDGGVGSDDGGGSWGEGAFALGRVVALRGGDGCHGRGKSCWWRGRRCRLVRRIDEVT